MSWGALCRHCFDGVTGAETGLSQEVREWSKSRVPWQLVWSQSGVGVGCSGMLCTYVTLMGWLEV